MLVHTQKSRYPSLNPTLNLTLTVSQAPIPTLILNLYNPNVGLPYVFF